MIHREGYPTLLISFIVLALISYLTNLYLTSLSVVIGILCLGLFIFLLSFFRNPVRIIPQKDDQLIYAPCDGKVVVIEDTEEIGYLKTNTKQVSIFMSPLNVHVNRHPVNGIVEHSEHHDGKFLPAWDPKSSIENERTTVVYQVRNAKIVMRQVAGALAKRIINYAKKNDVAVQGDEMGFIKFGSRVDLYLPLDAEILVAIGDVVTGNRTVIGKLK